MASQTAAEALDKLDGAHATLLRQKDLQFQLSLGPQPRPPPDWLVKLLGQLAKALGPIGQHLGPAAPYIVWTGLAVAAAFVLFLTGQRLFAAKRGVTIGRLSGAAEPWRPAPEEARALLEEADRLAAEGRFVEAAHLILLRSIQDIQARRPRAVAVSLTSRDIARLEVLPPPARVLFSGIAEAVEISLFGGQALDRDGYARCRDAYSSFAESGGWA